MLSVDTDDCFTLGNQRLSRGDDYFQGWPFLQYRRGRSAVALAVDLGARAMDCRPFGAVQDAGL